MNSLEMIYGYQSGNSLLKVDLYLNLYMFKRLYKLALIGSI